MRAGLAAVLSTRYHVQETKHKMREAKLTRKYQRASMALKRRHKFHSAVRTLVRQSWWRKQYVRAVDSAQAMCRRMLPARREVCLARSKTNGRWLARKLRAKDRTFLRKYRQLRREREAADLRRVAQRRAWSWSSRVWSAKENAHKSAERSAKEIARKSAKWSVKKAERSAKENADKKKAERSIKRAKWSARENAHKSAKRSARENAYKSAKWSAKEITLKKINGRLSSKERTFKHLALQKKKLSRSLAKRKAVERRLSHKLKRRERIARAYDHVVRRDSRGQGMRRHTRSLRHRAARKKLKNRVSSLEKVIQRLRRANERMKKKASRRPRRKAWRAKTRRNHKMRHYAKRRSAKRHKKKKKVHHGNELQHDEKEAVRETKALARSSGGPHLIRARPAANHGPHPMTAIESDSEQGKSLVQELQAAVHNHDNRKAALEAHNKDAEDVAQRMDEMEEMTTQLSEDAEGKTERAGEAEVDPADDLSTPVSSPAKVALPSILDANNL
jgi:hypothetical protein